MRVTAASSADSQALVLLIDRMAQMLGIPASVVDKRPRKKSHDSWLVQQVEEDTASALGTAERPIRGGRRATDDRGYLFETRKSVN